MPGVRAQILEGGVSSDVVRVDTATDSWIVKRPLAQFRVRKEWTVDVRRSKVEYDFARLVEQRLGSNVVAPALDHDPSTNTLVVRAAPAGYEAWKNRLLAGAVDQDLAGKAGAMLARIHRIPVDHDFDNIDLFHQQRLEPYLLEVARLHPSLSPLLHELVRGLTASKAALIHGDFSPKNLLTDGGNLLLVDHEVATRSDPRFDCAFFLNHLLLKACRGANAEAIGDACEEFLYQYGRAQGPARLDDTAGRILAALMLARIDGKSPVEYLSGLQQERARSFAIAALEHGGVPEELIVEALERLKA